MARVTLEQAEKNLPQLVADARAGEEVVILEGERPVARIVAIRPEASLAEPRRPGRFKGVFELDDRFFDPLPDDELEAWLDPQ